MLGPDFIRELEAFARRQNVEVSIAMEGSRDGAEKLKAGQADLAIVAFALDEAPLGPPMNVRIWAYHSAVVVVAEKLPLTHLSYPQLAGIFAAEGQTDLAYWGQVGIKSEWDRRAIIPHAIAAGAEGGLALELFRREVMREADLKPNVVVHEHHDGWLPRLVTTDGSIAILPIPPADLDGLKVLAVAANEGQPAYGPTPENVHSGDYPLLWPVHIIWSDQAAEKVRPWLEFLWSDEGAKLAAKANLVPLPAAARRGLSGKN